MNSWRLLESCWTLTILAVLALIVYGLTGCAAGACVKPVVQIEQPVLPTVPAAALQCLSDETYIALALRDRLLHDAVDECQLIVRELGEVPQ